MTTTLTQITDETDIKRYGLRQIGQPVVESAGEGSPFAKDINMFADSIAEQSASLLEATHFMETSKSVFRTTPGNMDILAYAFVFYAPESLPRGGK